MEALRLGFYRVDLGRGGTGVCLIATISRAKRDYGYRMDADNSRYCAGDDCVMLLFLFYFTALVRSDGLSYVRLSYDSGRNRATHGEQQSSGRSVQIQPVWKRKSGC